FLWRSLNSHSSNVAPIQSIAVLPFSDASKNPEMDYLGEGLSEEITNALSRLPNLQVMAHATVSHYKSRQDDPQGVGRDLHVDAVLTGRLAEHGNQLDAETELVSVGTGAQLWGERYTRTADDASQLQSSIVRDLVSQLRPQLTGSERESLAKVGTQDAEAYRLYLKGRYRYQRWTPEDLKAAAEFFEKRLSETPTTQRHTLDWLMFMPFKVTKAKSLGPNLRTKPSPPHGGRSNSIRTIRSHTPP